MENYKIDIEMSFPPPNPVARETCFGVITVLIPNSSSIFNEISPLLNITLFAVESNMWSYLARTNFAHTLMKC